MIKIGAVNIDVSHPQAFAAILHDSPRARYVAVFNDGFRENDEVEGFAKTENLEICATVDELAEKVDIGFIHSCDWDKHLDYAQAFIKRSKPVFIDKPIVGNMKDVERMRELCLNGAEIIGTSALRYCEEVANVNAKMAEMGASPLHTVVTVGVDEFSYAIHAVEEICAIHKSKPISCQFVGTGMVDTVTSKNYFIKFSDGSMAQYISMKGKFMIFNTIVVTSAPKPRTDFCFEVNNGKFYEAMLNKVCDYLEGDKTAMATTEEMLNSVMIMLAGKASEENGGIEVSLDSPLLYDVKYDGREYCDAYGKRQGKIYIK